ncbi:hypothetical protein A2960_00500 [Candidatus Gottesmanbacteria bacterium RIFCSPLOWO2_01_FULL_39_12b]|uniref:Sortase n=1 Tax=Candidatus Gottesmanbacteria bacterium RIFCSPLOWO2_01_FULL_39_12b TaxID=1798388 RepID=A0A1F6AQU0_9BACT|nr:MAG: hypothetical protein A2960_00500 [Candidatus Gottesmanbacteria bacterium RIFCSPLOWO2_01_FULL_39_12b]
MSSSLRQVKTYNKSAISLKNILRDDKKKMRLILLISGILLVTLSLFWPKNTPTAVRQTDQPEIVSFAQEPVIIDKNLLKERSKKEKEKQPPVRIVIPALEIDIPVKEAKIVKGYWEVFTDSAGFGSGTAYPEEMGNQVVFAHARKGLFLPLKNAKLRQDIYIFTKDKWYSYQIEDIKEVLPSQTEVIAPSSESILTLYTCSGFADSKRLIIRAKKIL